MLAKLLTIGVVAVACLSATRAAAAETGGAGYDPSLGAGSPSTGRPSPSPGTGGAKYGPQLRHRRDRGRPLLAELRLSRRSVFAYGRATRVVFRIRDRSKYVRARIDFVHRGGQRTAFHAHLGRIRTGITHTFRWTGSEGGQLASQGSYDVRLRASDPAGNRLIEGAASRRAAHVSFHWHSFPVVGPHTFGGPEGRFGAPRTGHTHQGQDIPAAEGTPIVAPRAGMITWSGYQATGAGNYLVLDAEGENYDYAFMHLQSGSTLVNKGDHVLTGQMLGWVGQTGDASGPHLHFELWRGAWYAGGQPTDPLPFLRAWDAYS